MERRSQYKVSAIVPVFGVEAFARRCATSLMEQTLEDIEYIFVDDCSPDDSVAIIRSVVDRYPARKPHCRIVAHAENKGLPAARNTGMALATGKYIFHCDSDDYLEPEMLRLLLDAAETNDADMAWCDYFLAFSSGQRVMRQHGCATAREALARTLGGPLKYNVWNKLVKRSIYDRHGIKFPSGHSMGEDMTMIKLLALSQRVAYVGEPLYHYSRANSESMTQGYSDSHLRSLRRNASRICEWLADNASDLDMATEIEWFKLNVKLPFLFDDTDRSYALWREWFRESNGYIMSNRHLPLRTRLLQQAAAWRMTFVNRLYNRFVFRVVYGRIYK